MGSCRLATGHIKPRADQRVSGKRGEVYQWTVFAMSELEPAVIQVHRARERVDTDAIAAAPKRLTIALGALERQLDGRN
jgi:glutathione S-transferase